MWPSTALRCLRGEASTPCARIDREFMSCTTVVRSRGRRCRDSREQSRWRPLTSGRVNGMRKLLPKRQTKTQPQDRLLTFFIQASAILRTYTVTDPSADGVTAEERSPSEDRLRSDTRAIHNRPLTCSLSTPPLRIRYSVADSLLVQFARQNPTFSV